MVFGQNGCVHRVLRSILSQKRPSSKRRREVWDFFLRFFGNFRVKPGTERVYEQINFWKRGLGSIESQGRGENYG